MTAHRSYSKTEKRKTTSISISEELLKSLDRIGYERNMSRCAVIRDALLRYIRSDRMRLTNDRKNEHK